METVRITAKTLDEAITKACIELGATSEMISYQVVETGSNGVFGIGARPYVIEASKKAEASADDALWDEVKKTAVTDLPEMTGASVQGEAAAAVRELAEANAALPGGSVTVSAEKVVISAVRADKTEWNPAVSESDALITEDLAESRTSQFRSAGREHRGADNSTGGRSTALRGSRDNTGERRISSEPRRISLSDEEKDETIGKAKQFLKIIFDGMRMEVTVDAAFDEDGELLIDLSGDDMGALIGKRGQTLDAMQYLVSQVINKRRSEYIRVRLDTEHYRSRRKQALESLARNIAYKVRRSRRPVALEAMNPYERRIIHSFLQNERDIETRSEGEEPYRHVVVYCTKRQNR